jgi:hypothetical protein
MKKTILLFAVLILFTAGCQESAKKGEPVKTTVKSDSNFPKFLVGVWEADTFRWAFKFEPDGKISRLIHTMGVPIKVEEGMYYSENPDTNDSGLFTIGPCNTDYDPETKVLKVSVILDYFHIEIQGQVLEGSSKDLFEGPVSEENLIWNVNWRNYGFVEGSDPPDVNEIDANPEKLVFRKVDIEKASEHKHQ